MQIEEFLPEVYLDAPGVPEAVALNALRNALRDFCRESGIWQADLDPITLKADEPVYDLDAPFGAEVVRVASATYRGLPVAMLTEADMDHHVTGWREQTGSGLQAVLVSTKTMRAFPVPEADDANTVTLRAVLQPKRDAERCDDALGRWNEAIAAGALAKLKAIPNQPWSDREAVAFYQKTFRSGQLRARGAVIRGNSERSLTVRPRRFGG